MLTSSAPRTSTYECIRPGKRMFASTDRPLWGSRFGFCMRKGPQESLPFFPTLSNAKLASQDAAWAGCHGNVSSGSRLGRHCASPAGNDVASCRVVACLLDVAPAVKPKPSLLWLTEKKGGKHDGGWLRPTTRFGGKRPPLHPRFHRWAFVPSAWICMASLTRSVLCGLSPPNPCSWSDSQIRANRCHRQNQ